MVCAKPALGRAQTVVDYLARYSRRTALSDSRIEAFDGRKVRLRWKDYRDGRTKHMDLEAGELIRRFLLHILPKRLQRIRHYGYLSNACRARKLKAIGKDIAEQANHPEPTPEPKAEATSPTQQQDATLPRCERCKGRMSVMATIPKRRRRPDC